MSRTLDLLHKAGRARRAVLALLSTLSTLSTLALLGGCTYRPASFDLAAARRADDLAATERPLAREGSVVPPADVALHEVRYTSLTWDAGGAHPIRIRAVVAVPLRPAPPHSRPGIVFAHGLGGQADAQTAIEMARNLDAVALSLSAPGLGGSEGPAVLPEDARLLFAGAQDIRHSWLYGYVYAVLRSITYLQTRPEVDPQAIALTGFSLGGLVTFIANGVDARIRGALPVAAAGGLREAAAADTWLRRLVQSSGGLRPEDPGPQALFRGLDPLAFARRQKGAVYMLIGAQDEYFPLPQAVRTFEALRAPDKVLTVLPDYDHGWYFGGGCPARCMPGGPRDGDCPAPPLCPTECPGGARWPYCGPEQSYNRQADFGARWSALLHTLVARHVVRPPRPLPPPPELPDVRRRGDEVVVRPEGPVRAVRLAVSDNCGFTFSQHELARGSDGAYRQVVHGAELVFFAEVESATGAVTTSVPEWPERCALRVRPFGPRPGSGP